MVDNVNTRITDLYRSYIQEHPYYRERQPIDIYMLMRAQNLISDSDYGFIVNLYESDKENFNKSLGLELNTNKPNVDNKRTITQNTPTVQNQLRNPNPLYNDILMKDAKHIDLA